MAETGRGGLCLLLAGNYEAIRARLARRLGSSDLATEALHDTFLRVGKTASAGAMAEAITDPCAYLFRAALNGFIDKARARARQPDLTSVIGALGVADPAPGPQRTVEGLLRVEALERAVQELTPRRRTILHASRLDGVPLRVIARRLGVSQRLVELELRAALEHCAERLDTHVRRRFGPKSARPDTLADATPAPQEAAPPPPLGPPMR